MAARLRELKALAVKAVESDHYRKFRQMIDATRTGARKPLRSHLRQDAAMWENVLHQQVNVLATAVEHVRTARRTGKSMTE